MEACYTVNICRKKAPLPFTEKAFLGRLCEEIASGYLSHQKKWKVIGRNVRFRFGELDLVAEDPKTQACWIVEVRGRKSSSHKAVWWLSPRKIGRLKRLAHLMATKTRRSYRILFLQVEVLKINEKLGQVQTAIKEFEIQGSEVRL